MRYKVSAYKSLTLLEQNVNDAIKNGWIPLGGISVAYSRTGLEYFQAMTKT